MFLPFPYKAVTLWVRQIGDPSGKGAVLIHGTVRGCKGTTARSAATALAGLELVVETRHGPQRLSCPGLLGAEITDLLCPVK